MQIMTKLTMWFVIGLIALPAFILSAPTKVQAAHRATIESAPVTRLTTAPKRPNENGWFGSQVLIKLKPDLEAKTYYQWNTAKAPWTEYDQAILAWKGENTLYYYSATAGANEAIKSQVIKVAYGHPANPEIQIMSAESQVLVSWRPRTDIASYRIAKNGDDLAKVSAATNYYLDPEVKVGETNLYKLKAVDQAGLKTKAIKKSVVVSAGLWPGEIRPMIGQGASIVAVKPIEKNVASTQIAKVAPKDETPPVATGTPPMKNWNRLFVALSILIIAAGAAIAGYYGYEWWVSRRENNEEVKDKKTSNRW